MVNLPVLKHPNYCSTKLSSHHSFCGIHDENLYSVSVKEVKT